MDSQIYRPLLDGWLIDFELRLLCCDHMTHVSTMMVFLGDFCRAAVVSEFELGCGRLFNRLLVKIRERHETRVNSFVMWLEGHSDIESLVDLSVFWNCR